MERNRKNHRSPESLQVLNNRRAAWGLLDLIESGLPGERMVYYTGFIMVDRGNMTLDQPEVVPAAQVRDPLKLSITGLADMAMEAALAGEVFLTQRRLGPGVYQYIATKRRK